MSAPRPLRGLPPLTEKQWSAQVCDLARRRRWRLYHTRWSIHSDAGWPDLALARPPRFVLAELKTDKGRLTPAQAEWLEVLAGCGGIETFLWRPADWDQVVQVLW